MQGYCVKCKEKREMQDVEQITMKNGKSANQGKCPECGTKMFKIGRWDLEPQAPADSEERAKKAVRAELKKSGNSKKAA